MQFTKLLGLAAVGAVLALASPANAVSLSNPGAAAAVQEDVKPETTEAHGGTATIITGGTAGTGIITTTITVTGAVGNRDSLAQNRSASSRACFVSDCGP